jgi:hypothetical protein
MWKSYPYERDKNKDLCIYCNRKLLGSKEHIEGICENCKKNKGLNLWVDELGLRYSQRNG